MYTAYRHTGKPCSPLVSKLAYTLRHLVKHRHTHLLINTQGTQCHWCKDPDNNNRPAAPAVWDQFMPLIEKKTNTISSRLNMMQTCLCTPSTGHESNCLCNLYTCDTCRQRAMSLSFYSFYMQTGKNNVKRAPANQKDNLLSTITWVICWPSHVIVLNKSSFWECLSVQASFTLIGNS